jgi:hypothetical protein
MLDDQVLADYIHHFYGYGSFRARYWFIGMEEGGGQSLAEVANRLDAWQRGRKTLEHLADFHRAIGVNQYFADQAVLQSTWKQLIRILLTADQQECTTESIRKYQRARLGTLDGDTCLLELLPLPSPGQNAFMYGKIANLPYIKDKGTYTKHCTPFRISHIRDELTRRQPPVLIFYGLGYRTYWEEIAQVTDWEGSPGQYLYATKSQTLSVIVKHPVAYGASNAYYEEIGRFIRRERGA